MAYEFRRVDIRIFDFHLCLDPILTGGSLKPVVAFLGDPAKYKAQFDAKPVAAGAFRIRPLRKKSRTYHHFWKYYTAVFGEFDPWSLLLPFLCEPTQYELGLTAPAKGIRAFARPAVYLFPFGWATTIEMSLHGKMTAAQLRDFMGSVRNAQDGPFTLDGKPLGLSAVLKKYGEELKKACFTKELMAPDLLRVDRHIIVSLSEFAGDIRYYKPRRDTDPAMPAGDKAALHEILLGTSVSPASVAAAENPAVKADFLLTRFSDSGFAITYFDVGTLLFVQNKAKSKDNAQAMHCLTTNLMSSMMMVRSLQSFYDFPEKKGAANPLLTQTRDAAMQQLVELRSRYRNAVVETWYKFYASMKKFVLDEKDDKEKDAK